MTCVAGADGCKAGWVVVLRDVKSREMEVKIASRVEEILRWKPRPEILGIDMPIGLLDQAVRGGRECDKEARKLLGKPRGSSVFSPPARTTLKAQTCDEADTMNRATGPHAPGISRQACAIIPKISEVDEFITRSLQRRVVEVHPELCFYEMNRRTPIVESKKSAAGRKLRIRLLTRVWAQKLSDLVDSRPQGVARDDILDAMAVCWTAERVLKAKAVRIPRDPPHDSKGLRMEIVR
jgi:predicted RNase H-like nuclease